MVSPHGTHSSSSGGHVGNGGGVLVVSQEIDGVVFGGMVYVVVARHSIDASVMVVSTSSPGGTEPSVMVVHSDA